MSRKKQYGFGIVGCGAVAGVHAAAIQALPGATLVSAYSRQLKNARNLAEKSGIKAFDDWEKFISDPALDIVSICTPGGTHLDYGKLAAEAGKQVVVEKPIEVTVERGRALIDACRRRGVKLAVIYQNRFSPVAQTLKETIERGDLGNIFLADAYIKWYREQAYYDSAAWRGTLALDGGGVLINQAIHTIDLLQWIAGGVEQVYAQTARFSHRRIEGEDTAVAVLRFKNGALGVIEGSTAIQPARERRLEIHGERGTAILNGNQLQVWVDNREQPPAAGETQEKAAGGSAGPWQNFSTVLHQRQFESILTAIDQNREPPVPGEESLESLAIVRAIYESAVRGMPVQIEEVRRRSHGKYEAD